MVLCANHHRQMHYGRVDVVIQATAFDVTVEGMTVSVPKPGTTVPAAARPKAALL